MAKRRGPDSIARVDEALVRARFWSDHRDTPLNPEQRKVLNRMLEAGPGRFEGGLTPRKYRALTGTTNITASRHIADLVEKGVIARAEGAAGRSTHYNLTIPGWDWQPRRRPRIRPSRPQQVEIPLVHGPGIVERDVPAGA